MLEEAIERLTVEVQRLREAVERQTILPQRAASEDALSGAGRTAGCRAARKKGGDEFLTERGVAELTGLGLGTLRNWRLLRKGPPFRKLGWAVRYSRADVVAWMDARRVG